MLVNDNQKKTHQRKTEMANNVTKNFKIEDFQLRQNYVIEASAGTGKTYNIVQMVKKLLDEDKSLDLNQILILTYTEKAAGELKDRIRSIIKNANTDNAPISTFHSFCKTTIEQYPFAVRQPSILSLVDESKLIEFAKSYIRQGKILSDLTTYIAYLVKEKKTSFSEETFINKLVKTCIAYYLKPDGQEDNTIVTFKPIEGFAYINAKSIDEVYALDPEIEKQLEVLKKSNETKCKELAAILKSNYKTFSYDAKKYQATKNMLDKEKNAIAFFRTKRDTIAKSKFAESIISIYLKDFYMSWKKEKEKNNYQTFDDMINIVRERVLEKDSKLLECLRKQFRYAIIDEFQDTNQKQFDIFSRVFLCEGHNIIVVGDPKQSIYSFQGADVFVYKKAVNEILAKGGIKCRLSKNYRSTKGIVSSCNDFFACDGFIKNYEPSDYLSIKENNDRSEFDVTFDGKPIKAFWITEKDNVSKSEYAKIVTQKIVECCTIVGKDEDNEPITRLMVKDKSADKFRHVTFRDFTVLAKTRTEMPAIEKALAKAGIPFIRYKDNGLFKDSECFHWIALLQAINVPDFTGSRRKVFKRALFTDFFGLSLGEINKKKYNSDQIPEVDYFHIWRGIISKGNYDSLIDDILIRSGIVERMSSLNNIQKLNKYRQIGDYCSDFLTKTHSLDALIDNLINLSKGGSNDDSSEDESIVQKGIDFDCVQIMTMHASKGLQFPVVISVTGLKGYMTSQENYIFHDKDNNNLQTISFESNSDFELERDDESLRLLYVGYTRAQYIMMLPRYQTNSSALPMKVKQLIETYVSKYPQGYWAIKDNNKNYDELSTIIKTILPTETPDIKGRDDQDSALMSLIKDKKKKESHKRSYSNLSHPKKDDSDEYDEDEGTVFDKEGQENEGLAEYDRAGKQIPVNYSNVDPIAIPNRFPKGSEVGSALHEIFEKTDFTDHENGLDELIEERFDANKLPLDPDFTEYIHKMVDNVLNGWLPEIHGSKETGKRFKLSEIKDSEKKPEIEFNINLHDERLKNYFNGFIDLLFRRDEYYSILDWKSDTINDRDLPDYKTADSLKTHTDNAYSIQRVLYCYFLIEWLTLKYGEDREKIFNEHFGGIYYVYLRGCTIDTFNGIYSQTWDSYADLKSAYENIVKKCIGGRKK